jgi:hypothetical protein
MRSPNGSIHTSHTPPPLSFYNTFKVGNSGQNCAELGEHEVGGFNSSTGQIVFALPIL